MTFDIRSAMPQTLPQAIRWAKTQSETALRSGRSLDDEFLVIAQSVGVANPKRIRILDLPLLPMPDDPLQRQAAVETGLLGPKMDGLTLGYAVLVCPGFGHHIRLLSREFHHVYQYEQAGSIDAFLSTYLHQVVNVGYHDAPLERDARAHQRSA